MVNEISQAVHKLKKFWESQKIDIVPGSKEKVEYFQSLKGYHLPSDFKEFYFHLNGMEKYYPNNADENGFLFYPIESVDTANILFKGTQMRNCERVFIFCDYMQRSWWYGCEVLNKDNYAIGIISEPNSFKSICHSFAEFIELYINDSPVLYDYR